MLAEGGVNGQVLQGADGFADGAVGFLEVEGDDATAHLLGKAVELPGFYHTHSPRLASCLVELPRVLHNAYSEIALVVHN